MVSIGGSTSGLGGVDVGEGDVGGMQLCWGRGGSLSVEDSGGSFLLFFLKKKNSFTIMDKNKAYAKHSVSSFVFTPKKKERKKKKKDYGAHYR